MTFKGLHDSRRERGIKTTQKTYTRKGPVPKIDGKTSKMPINAFKVQGSPKADSEVTGSPCMICPEGTWSAEGTDLCERCSLASKHHLQHKHLVFAESTTEIRMIQNVLRQKN